MSQVPTPPTLTPNQPAQPYASREEYAKGEYLSRADPATPEGAAHLERLAATPIETLHGWDRR